MASAPTAIARGFSPTAIVAVTTLLAGSIRETVPSARLATQTEPKPPAASAVGPLPTLTACTTAFARGSTRETLALVPFAT